MYASLCAYGTEITITSDRHLSYGPVTALWQTK